MSAVRLGLAKLGRRVYQSGSSLVWQLLVELRLEPGTLLNTYVDDRVCSTTVEPLGGAALYL